MEQAEKFYGVHENGKLLTANELNERQPLAVVRVAQGLVGIGMPLMQDATREERNEFEKLLKRMVITPHGDPSEEWKEFASHRDEQKEVISALLRNPIGFKTLMLFRNHMAHILGDGTREVGTPVEVLEFELESYSEDFVQILAELSDKAAAEHAPSTLLEIGDTLESQRKLIDVVGQTRSLIGSVCPNTDYNKLLMNYEVTQSTFSHHREPTWRSVA